MEYTLFSPKLYLQGIKKIRAAGIASAICILILNAIIPIIALIENSFHFPGMAPRAVEEVSRGLFAPFSYLFVLFAPLMVYLMFSYLNERSKSDFYHSLPQTRTCVFVSFSASILTWVAAILIGSYFVNAILWGIAPYYHLSFSTIVVSFVNYFVLSVFMAGFMSLAMTLTGTTVSNVLIFILVTLFARTVGTFFIYSVEEITPIWLLSESWLKVLSFEYFLPFNLIVSIFESNSPLASPWMLLYSFLMGLAMISASCWLYQKRRSETAGQSAPNKILQVVYRSAVTLPFLLIMVLTLFLDREFESYQIILLSIAILVYTLYELMTTKKVKTMFKSLTKFYIPVLAAFVFFCSVYATSNSINAIQPEPDEIAGVSVANRIHNGASYETMVTSNIFVDSEEVNEIISKYLKEYANGNQKYDDWNDSVRRMYTEVIIKLNTGLKIGRKFSIPEPVYNTLFEEIVNSTEYKNKIITLPDEDMIREIAIEDLYYGIAGSTGTEDIDIWKSFVEEYNSLSDDEKAEYKLKLSINSYYTSNSLLIRVNGYYTSREYFSSSYPLLPEYMPKTLTLAADRINFGYIGSDPKSAFNEYYDGLTKALEDESNEFSVDIVMQRSGYDYHYTKYISSLNTYSIEGYKNIVKFLADSNDIFDFENAEKQLYRIELSADVHYEYDSKYTITNYYNRLQAYIMLTDQEAQKIIDYTEKGLTPYFDIEK